jgi:hypothetical protein
MSRRMPARGRVRAASGPALALALAAAAAPAAAQGIEEDERFLPPLTLPESLNGVVRTDRPVRASEGGARIDTIRQMFQAVQACWRPPAGSGWSGQEITVRMSFKRSGEVLGEPRITFYREGGSPEERAAFTRSVRETFERCTPLPFTDAFGGAVAGRPITFRFTDSRAL